MLKKFHNFQHSVSLVPPFWWRVVLEVHPLPFGLSGPWGPLTAKKRKHNTKSVDIIGKKKGNDQTLDKIDKQLDSNANLGAPSP